MRMSKLSSKDECLLDKGICLILEEIEQLECHKYLYKCKCIMDHWILCYEYSLNILIHQFLQTFCICIRATENHLLCIK